MNEPVAVEKSKEGLPAPVIDTPPDVSPLFNYLRSPEGHDIAKGVLRLFESLQTLTLSKNLDHARYDRLIQLGMVFVVIVAASVLACFDKLSPVLGTLLGTVAGYFMRGK